MPGVTFKHKLTKLENTARSIGNRDAIQDLNLNLQSQLVLMENKAKDLERFWKENNKKREEELKRHHQKENEMIQQHQNKETSLKDEYFLKEIELKDKHSKILEQDKIKIQSINNKLNNIVEKSKQEKILSDNITNELNQLKKTCFDVTQKNNTLDNRVKKYEKENITLQKKQKALVKLLRETLIASLKVTEKIVENCESNLLAIYGLESDNQSIKTIDIDQIKKTLNLSASNEKWAVLGAEYGANIAYQSIIKKYISKVKTTITENKNIADKLKIDIDNALKDGDILEKEIATLKQTANEHLYNIKTQISAQGKLLIILQSSMKKLESENIRLARMIKEKDDELIKAKEEVERLNKENKVLADKIKKEKEEVLLKAQKEKEEQALQNKKEKEENAKMQQQQFDEFKLEQTKQVQEISHQHAQTINDIKSQVQIENNKNKIEVARLTNELAISKKREAIQIKVKEATKKEWYPGYSTGGKVGAFLVDFVLVIPPIMNLLGWILSGFGFAKNFRTIMQEKAGNDYEQQLMSEIDNEPEIYDVSTQKSSSSYQDMHDKKVIALQDDIVDGAGNNNDKPTKIVKTLVQSSVVIGAENNKDKMDEIVETNANNDLPSNATTPEPKTFVIN